MKVKLYVEGLNAWKSRRWITSKKELDLILNILIGGMLGNQEYTFSLSFVCVVVHCGLLIRFFNFCQGPGGTHTMSAMRIKHGRWYVS